MTPRFDPTRAIVYDLSQGQLRDDEGSSRLNLPVTLLARLCEHAGEQGTLDFARSLGSELGRRIADRMGESTSEATVENWTEHLGGQLALVGLGDLSVEQWGKALVLRVTGAPDEISELISPVLQGTIARGLGRDVGIVECDVDKGRAYLVLSPDAAKKARNSVDAGAGLGQIVEQLHQGNA